MKVLLPAFASLDRFLSPPPEGQTFAPAACRVSRTVLPSLRSSRGFCFLVSLKETREEQEQQEGEEKLRLVVEVGQVQDEPEVGNEEQEVDMEDGTRNGGRRKQLPVESQGPKEDLTLVVEGEQAAAVLAPHELLDLNSPTLQTFQ